METFKPIHGDILFPLFQQVDVRIWYYDPNSDRICYVKSNGQPEEDIPFDEHMAMKHPDDCQQVYDSIAYMRKHREPCPDRLMIRYRDANQPDGYRYTVNACTPIFDGNKMWVYGSEQDITGMVRKQQLAEKQTKMIEELLLSRNEDIWNVNRKSEILHIKRQDGTEEDLTFQQLESYYEIDENQEVEKSIDAFRNGEARILQFHLKETKPRKDGNRHCFRCTAMPSKYDYKGNVVEYIGVDSDITKEVEDKRRLNEALAEAKEQSHKKSVFVARASHDLRNPLNVLLSIADMMCMDMPLEERQELSEMMKQSGEALLLLINDILDLSRIESGIQFTKEEFDIKGLVEDVIQSFQISSGKEHNIALQADVTMSTVNSDSKRLTQIVSNYLSNAIKYSPTGSDILVTLCSNDEGIYIAVKDQGCGIGEEDKKRVFDEFARFNTEVNGTGLGLSICKRIAEGLGGTVGFESQLGVGSTFWVKI